MRLRLLCTALLACISLATDANGERTTPITLPEVTVTATRVGKPAFEIPAAIDRVALDEPVLGASLAESLQALPGISVRDRQNYAQDTQISIRGFGARSPFGIRGVRLYLDGIPATQPDGQGQISHFNLASAGRVEVLRGPFSALYGNSSGGVIQLFTADSPAQPTIDFAGFGSSRGDQRISVVGAGYGVVAGASHFSTDGDRPQSAAERTSLNFKLDRAVADGQLTLLLNHLEAPDAQDPLGLNRAQLQTNPRQTAAAASQFDTRKNTQQTQAGLIYQGPASPWGGWRLMTYGGQREIEQFLAIPVAPQGNPRHAGGVIDLLSDYGGAEARWSLAQESLTLVGGVSLDVLQQRRRGFENFIGRALGVRGALRRDERNKVSAFDQFVQLDWRLSPRTSLLAGLRHSSLRFESRDRFVHSGNPDDSGSVRYSAVTPVAGLMFRLSPVLNAYAAYGTGFETPTFAELAYRSDGQAGLNFQLAPARSRNAELGLKWQPRAATEASLALFRIDTRDELVTVSNSGGRSSFANAARTQRLGAEWSLQSALTRQLDLSLAYTLLDATVRQAYGGCLSIPCTAPQVQVPRGAEVAGIAKGQGYARLRLKPMETWQLAAEVRYLAAVPVNDINSEYAPSYGMVDLEALWRLSPTGGSPLRLSARIENLLNARYAGSVIVNDANGRYYEPARGRSVLLGVEMQLRP